MKSEGTAVSSPASRTEIESFLQYDVDSSTINRGSRLATSDKYGFRQTVSATKIYHDLCIFFDICIFFSYFVTIKI